MGNTKQIGLLIERSRAFGRTLCEGIITFPQERQWELRYLAMNDITPRHLAEYDGFIARVTTETIAEALAATRKPVVDVFYNLPNYGFSIVKERHDLIGSLAAEHFLDRHFKNFAYCPFGVGKTSVYCRTAFLHRLRRKGFSCAVFASATEIAYQPSDSEIIVDRMTAPRDAKNLGRWIRQLPKPVAVFCPDDLRAWQMLETCQKLGFRVPDEIAVLGLDNDILICGGTRPMLSSIDPNTLKIGNVAAETLERLMTTNVKDPLVRQVPPLGVVTRASTEVYPITPPWLSDALVFINRQAKNRISAADVFAHLGRSHTLVSRAFSNVLHTTVQKEISRVRLETACDLLRTTAYSLEEIARLSGYSTYTYFMQSFKSALHQPPGQWRENNHHL